MSSGLLVEVCAGEVFNEGLDGDGGQLPLQGVEDLDLPAAELLHGHGVVGVQGQLLRAERPDLAELAGQQEAAGGQGLEALLGEAGGGGAEEAVQVGHGVVEHVGHAPLVLAHLQHPVNHDLAHVRLDLGLEGGAVVGLVHGPLLGQHVGHHPLVVQDGGVGVRGNLEVGVP